MASQPQSNFQDLQNYDIDIEDMYVDFVTGGTTNDNNNQNIAIDDLRSQINIDLSNLNSTQTITALNLDGSSSTSSSNSTTPGNITQESRCHTFFRIIGFPVVNSNKSNFYNSGFDIIKNSTRKIKLADKLTIAKDPIAGFNALSYARENYVNNVSKIFSVPSSLNAGLLALTSGTYSNGGSNLRIFNAPFNIDGNSDPFNTDPSAQSYSINTASLVGNIGTLLALYQDGSGNFPDFSNANNLFSKHLHIIKPFIVDPRIDFSVYPIDSSTAVGTSKRVGIPFVPDKSYLKTSANSYAERPLIEKIIRDRYASDSNISDNGSSIDDLIAYVQEFKSIQSNDLVSQVFSGNLYSLDQQTSFTKNLAIIKSMITKLNDCLKTVHKYQGKYYWVPQPNNNTGSEGGFTVRPVFINQNISSILIPEADMRIILKYADATLTNLNVSINQPNSNTPDKGGFAFSGFKITFAPDSTNSMGNLSGDALDTLNSTRNADLTKAGKALQIIELIMGEFSGLGLCDIVAIIAALYVVDFETLVGFLDADALDRMNTTLGTSYSSQSITTTMQTFSNTVQNFYQIMDSIFLDISNNNAQNS